MNTKNKLRATIISVLCMVLFLSMAAVECDSRVYAGETVKFIESATVWNYYDQETDPAEGMERNAWTQEDFDISGWKTNSGSEARFGAKQGKLASVDSYMPDVLLKQYKEGTDNNIEAFFFRTCFEVEKIPEDYILTGSICYDDAALIYLNGELAAEFDNKQKSDSTKAFTANMQYGGHGSSVKQMQFQIDTSLLKEGTNILAVELHQVSKSSSDIYFEMESLSLKPFVPQMKSLTLNVGENENCRNITWYYNDKDAGEVHYAQKNGTSFPDEYEIAYASAEETNYGYLYSNKAVLSDLEPDSEYVYRIVNDDYISDIYSFKTVSEESFSFLAVGDPQLGNKAVETGAEDWKYTLNKSIKKFPETAFLLSAGDQVDKASNEAHYDALLENDVIKSLPLATSIGNHDEDSPVYSQHFNNPNVCEYGNSDAGSSYWFKFNNVLFMNMNSNSGSIDEHKEFLKSAIEANPDAKWRIVTFHHSIYSAANHAEDSSILKRRETYVPMFDELDIDLVLMGHDHVYVRTHIIKNLKIVGKHKNQNYAVAPDGILYITMNSSSGSKMYNVKGEYSYAAVQMQEKIPNIMNVEVTDDMLKITVHRVDENMSIADSFNLYHENIMPEAPEKVSVKLYGYDDIKVEWKKVKGADGYRVYSKKGSDPWKYYSTVKTKDYSIVTNRTPGSSYKIKVVPYIEVEGKKIEAEGKTSASIMTLKKVKTKPFKRIDSKVSVRWNNISGESGYQVARSTKKNGTYYIIKTVKTTKGNYYRVKAAKNKIYYYKVRAYKQVGDSKVKGPWSAPVKFIR